VRIVSYATPRYASEEERLVISTMEHDEWLQTVRLPDRGSWQRNARAKVAVMLRQWMEKGPAFLWLDADAEVLRPIPWHEVPDGTDIGVHYHPSRPDGFPSPGTVYVGQTEQAYLFLMEWIERCSGDHTDQDTFNDALESAGDVNLWRMPTPWCWIPDIDGPIPDPIIQHHQASRRLRHT